MTDISPSIVLARRSDDLRTARERLKRAAAEMEAACTDVQAKAIAVVAAMQDAEDEQQLKRPA